MNKPRLLIADDNEELIELYKTIFEKESFTVIAVADGEEALRVALEEKPDLIILDIMMPKKTGLEVLRELKSNPVTSNIPVIILTVLFQKEAQTEAINLGASFYLVKEHFSPSDVVKTVKEELGLNPNKK